MNDEIISAEQLYKILHCSKRKTKYLLDNGIIPCENNGKKTRCYRVKMSDVMIYLENTLCKSNFYCIPAGIFSSQNIRERNLKNDLSIDEYWQLCKIIRNKLTDKPDALSVDETATATGYSKTFILKIIQQRDLYAEKVLCHYIIPKEKLVRYLAGKSGLAIKYKSDFHKEVIRQFTEEINPE